MYEITIPILDKIISLVSVRTGLTHDTSQILLIAIISYIVGFIILRKIHKKLLKKKIDAQKQCTFEYDNIIYLIAKEEHKIQANITNSPIKELFEKKQKNYLIHHELILNAIRKLETETKQIIYTPEMEKKILRLRKKITRNDMIQKIFGIVLSIATAGIYLLFW